MADLSSETDQLINEWHENISPLESRAAAYLLKAVGILILFPDKVKESGEILVVMKHIWPHFPIEEIIKEVREKKGAGS